MTNNKFKLHWILFILLIFRFLALAENKLSHRKGILIVQTEPGENVRVQQLKHDFRFGTAISTRAFENVISEQDRKKYFAVLKKNFNYAVHENAMKWTQTERNQGNISYDKADRIYRWCEENGIKMRGHCVYWGVKKHIQPWVKELYGDELKKTLKHRAFDLLRHYKGRISEFDVNNEMLHGDYFLSQLGEEIRVDMFRWCKEANPNSILYLNDYGLLSGKMKVEKYADQIQGLLDMGAPVGGIGLQGHIPKDFNLYTAQKVLDRLAEFNLPITVTEFDVKSMDEEYKAETLQEIFRLCFEHPAVEGILLWGFWSKLHWHTHRDLPKYTALWDADWNPTPSVQAYRDLVFREWWTEEEKTANEKGRCVISVFYGRYRITCAGKMKVIDVDSQEKIKRINWRKQ